MFTITVQVSSVDNMCSGETARMSLRCSRGFLIYFGPSCPASELNSYTIRHGEILYMQ